jgi:hypothetical protein
MTTLPCGDHNAETVGARKATYWDRREYRLRWRKKSERDKGTSWEREGSPFRPTKTRYKPRPHGERALFRISAATSTMPPAGPSASIKVPGYSATVEFLQVLAEAPSPFHANYCQSVLYGFDSGVTRCQPPPVRFRCHCRPSKKTRPQARERQGAWSVDAGGSQRGVQSDVRRDGDGRRRDLLRRAARRRRGLGRSRS